MKILGIDPGTAVMGYAVLELGNKTLQVVTIDVLRIDHIGDHHTKLKMIFECVRDLIAQHQPEKMAIEAPFHGKNVQSMLKLGRAQGVAMAAGMVAGLMATEYSPKEVKQAVTGNGNASKAQVAAMLHSMIKMEAGRAMPLDATDALAVAVCHHFRHNSIVPQADKSKGWTAFLKNNPQKVV